MNAKAERRKDFFVRSQVRTCSDALLERTAKKKERKSFYRFPLNLMQVSLSFKSGIKIGCFPSQMLNLLRYYSRISSAPSITDLTTLGSSKVEMSPKLVVSPDAILRKIRRMIFPERVLGNPRTI